MKKAYDLGLRCEWAIPMVNGDPQVIENFFIGIRDGEITAARPLRLNDAKNCRKFLNKKKMVAIPGLINGHAHLAMTMMKGLAEDMPLHPWLFEKILPFESAYVNREYVKTGTALAALECLRFGTTTVYDHYFFAEAAAEVWDDFGLRGIFSQCCNSDSTPEDDKLKGDFASRFKNLFKKYKGHPRIEIALGPHAPYTCKDDLLRHCVEITGELGARLHIHLSETEQEVKDSLAQYKERPPERLQRLGFLGPNTICAHGVHLSDSDIQLLKKSGSAVVHNPDSNAKIGSGVAPLQKLAAAGVPVALGTDGSATNNDLSLFGAMDLGAKMQKLWNHDPSCIRAGDMLRYATYEGARALKLDHKIGSLEEGKRADIVLIDFSFPHLQPIHDVLNNLVYCCQGLEVDTVICDGRILRQNQQWHFKKSQSIYEKAEKFRKSIAKKVHRSL